VPETDRIVWIDVLRGFALLGVLWSRLDQTFSPTAPASGLQYALQWAQDWLLDTRFYTLLGFLFGFGFAVQVTRSERRGIDPRKIFLKRMAALLGIGIVHWLVWPGDILTTYALLGVLLLPFRRFSPRGLLIAALLLLVLVPYLINAGVVGFGVRFPPPQQQQSIDQIYAHGSFAEIVAQSVRSNFYSHVRWKLFTFPPFLALFVLGLWAAKADLLRRVIGRQRLLAAILLVSVAVTLLGGYLFVHFEQLWPKPTAPATLSDMLFHSRALRPIAWRIIDLSTVWGDACAYAAGLALMLSIPGCARVLGPLAAVGRMSLTTYLTQSLITVFLFFNYGLGWYGRVGYDGMLAITLVIFRCRCA